MSKDCQTCFSGMWGDLNCGMCDKGKSMEKTLYTKHCKECGAEFTTEKKIKVFCTRKCNNRYYSRCGSKRSNIKTHAAFVARCKEQYGYEFGQDKKCVICGTAFTPTKPWQKFCGYPCYRESCRLLFIKYRKEGKIAPKSKKVKKAVVKTAIPPMPQKVTPQNVTPQKPVTAAEREYVRLCKDFDRPVHYCSVCGRPTPDRKCRQCRGYVPDIVEAC